jgi:hypothetical protein
MPADDISYDVITTISKTDSWVSWAAAIWRAPASSPHHDAAMIATRILGVAMLFGRMDAAIAASARRDR